MSVARTTPSTTWQQQHPHNKQHQTMPDCVDLTLDSDEEGPSGPSSRDKRRSPSTSSDVVIVDAEDVSRQPKKARSSGAAAADDMDEDIVIESETLGTVGRGGLQHFSSWMGCRAAWRAC